MIVIGYPGIGKSTLAGKDNKYIDLESGLNKDYLAWLRAEHHYYDDIKALMKVPFASCRIPLTSMDYDLKEEIENIVIR